LLNGKPRFPAQAHDGEIILAHESSEFGLVASVSRHGDLQVWNTLMNQRVQQRLQHSLAEVTITDDCSLLAMGPRKESSVQVWSIHQRMSTRRFTAPWDRELVEKPVFTKDSPEVFLKASALGWNPSLSLIACADADGHVQVHEAHSGKPRGITFQHSPAVGAVALSADGHLAATSGRDQEVRLWDGITGTSKGIVIRPGGFVSSLALSSDSQRLATVTDDGEIRVWETKQGNCLTPAIHAEQGINAILISEDGTHLFYRVPKSGWFSLPMPPLATHLPDWFLSLAESLARRRLSSEGKTVSLSLADLKLAVAAVPKHSREEDALALRWTRWLLADPYQRALSPIEGESFGDYLKSLQNEPAAAGEALRFLRNLP